MAHSTQTLKGTAVNYFAWGLNMCICAKASGLFVDIIPEDGQVREFSPPEEERLGQSFERMAANRFRDCGQVSRIRCTQQTTPEYLYFYVGQAIRSLEIARHAKKKEERELPVRSLNATEQVKAEMERETASPALGPINPTSNSAISEGATASRTVPGGNLSFGAEIKEAAAPAPLAPISPYVLIIQDIDRASPRITECITEMLAARTLSPPPVTSIGVLPETLQLPPNFIIVAISARVPRPSTTTNFETNPAEGRLPDRLLNAFFMRIPIILPKVSPPPSVAPPQLTRDRLRELMEAVPEVHINASIIKYVRDCVSAVRSHPLIACGLPPKSAEMLCLALRTQAALRGSRFVIPDDVTQCVIEVFSHRVIVVPQEVLPPELTEENAVYLARFIVASAVSALPSVH